VPAVPGQERHAVDDREALDPLGHALGEGQADAAPVVHEHAHALDAAIVQEALDEPVVLRDRVGERAGLARAAEAGQVRGHAAAEREHRQPVIRVRRHPVQVERNGAARAGGVTRRGLAPEDGQPVQLAAMLGDLGHAARI